MRICVDQTGICEPADLARGNDILSQERLSRVEVEITEDRQISARARAIDLFNFVSHPQLRIHANGERLLYYRCDCPDYRLRGKYCEHCAALAEQLGREEAALEIPPASAAAGDPALPEFEIEADPNDDLYEVSLRDLTYRFSNSFQDLYGDAGPSLQPFCISEKSFIQMHGLLFGRELYRMLKDQTWRGNCFGFTSSSALMFCRGTDVHVTDFRAEAEAPSQLSLKDAHHSWDLTVASFIEMMQIGQVNEKVINWRNALQNGAFRLRDVVFLVDSFSRSGENPILIDIWGPCDGQAMGHSIFPYRFERQSKNNGRLLIYDPNFPGRIRYMPVEIDDDGNFVHWRYFMNDYVMWGDEVPESYMTYVSYDMFFQLWSERCGAKGGSTMLQVPQNVVVEDSLGAAVLKVSEEGVETYRDDVREIRITTGTGTQGKRMFYLNPGAYLIRSTDAERETLEFRLICGNHAAAVNTQSQTAAICISDTEDVNSVSVQEKNRAYRIELSTEKDNALERAELSGTTGEYGVTFARVKGELCAEHAENAELRINDEVHALSELKALERQEQKEKEKKILYETVSSASEPEDPEQDA